MKEFLFLFILILILEAKMKNQKLRFKKIDCMQLHAKASKQDRKNAIDKFRSGKINVLITSDLCARGLDIPNITHVIQMDLPSDDDFHATNHEHGFRP